MKKNVLLFADFGVDDILAYMYGVFHQEINIIGVVASYGNVTREYSLRNIELLKKLTKTEHIQVIKGAERPLTGNEVKVYPEVHGQEGLGPFSFPLLSIGNEYNFDKIYELVRNNKELTIVNVGRLTSLATAFIYEPNLMKSVKEIFVMGGAFQVQGNITPVAEANIYSDFIAANIVNKIAPSIKYFPLDVTTMAVISEKQMDVLTKYFPAKTRQLLIEIHKYYTNFYEKKHFVKCSPQHDLLTIWALINEQYVTYEEKCVKIVVNSIAKGQTIGYDERSSSCSFIHKVATFIDYERFIQDVTSTFHHGSVTVIDSEWL
ncbi:nucleoside hydrolase [Lottiidibacillus patelloidae]|nr:nucleoside hydrolase [Lottiidibacillus patelloidae]